MGPIAPNVDNCYREGLLGLRGIASQQLLRCSCGFRMFLTSYLLGGDFSNNRVWSNRSGMKWPKVCQK